MFVENKSCCMNVNLPWLLGLVNNAIPKKGNKAEIDVFVDDVLF